MISVMHNVRWPSESALIHCSVSLLSNFCLVFPVGMGMEESMGFSAIVAAVFHVELEAIRLVMLGFV